MHRRRIAAVQQQLRPAAAATAADSLEHITRVLLEQYTTRLHHLGLLPTAEFTPPVDYCSAAAHARQDILDWEKV
eukprot:COSAG05_NODE_9141_length_644_cov_0.950459_1_plen_74_part_10